MRSFGLFAILSFVTTGAGAADSYELALEAKKHLNAARYQDAAKYYAKWIEVDPAEPAAYYGRVRALLEAHQSDEALKTADLALRKAPNTALSEVAAGLAEIRRGEIGNAERHFRAAQQLDPQSAAVMSGLARIYACVSLVRKARELHTAAYRRAPDDSDLILKWAIL